ncbi:MAG: hypothetical protein Ta2A_06560 [Treponemataceae bacterium]|nr:MAG: hypothetical protein Ta2A_06560 [Treponemataceae bacterium]
MKKNLINPSDDACSFAAGAARNLQTPVQNDRFCVKQSFSKNEHIKNAKEIKSVFKEGRKVSVFGAKLFYRQGRQDQQGRQQHDAAQNRIAFIMPRGYKNAVERNRSKRLCREVYRLNKHRLSQGSDILFLVYPEKNKKQRFDERLRCFEVLCKKACLLKK